MRVSPHIPPGLPSSVPCPIAFVGEAPGADERLGPFEGEAGRIFNVILRNANIDRGTCLVTNVFDQQAPDNDVGPWLRDEVRLAEARARLAEELEAAQPSVIVPLGGPALFAFTGHLKISKFRGSLQQATFIRPGAKLLPTYHPMAVQHKWLLLGPVVQDYIKAAAEAAKGPVFRYPNRILLLCPSVGEVEDFLSGPCSASKLLSVDIETGWGCITCIGFAPDASIAMCVPLVDLRQPNKSYWQNANHEKRVWKAINAVLRDGSIPKLGQNFIYDAFWLADYGIEVRNYLHDTRLLHHALCPELPKDLASMAGSYTNLPAWKHWGGGQEEKRDA